MILARCPHCETTFRAAPEALKQRAGKVRCGKCHQVFNALDQIVTDLAPAAVAANAAPAFVLTPPPAETAAVAPAVADAPTDGDADDASAPELTEEQPEEALAEAEPHPAAVDIEIHPYDIDHAPVAEAAAPQAEESAPTNSAADAEPLLPPGQDPLFEAQAAGLVAARDTREVPGYSKWAEGTLSAPAAHFDEAHRAGWLVVVLAVVLGLMLLVQGIHHWRMEIANRWPDTRPWLEEACHSFNCTVPYARDISQINLEASELQIDPERGNMLVLNMTIKNRAPFAQAFPAVELTLTDARDQVVVRRILAPNEWLPANLDSSASNAGKNPVSTPPAFPADKEIAARLWIDARDTGAVGYRLFVFYP